MRTKLAQATTFSPLKIVVVVVELLRSTSASVQSDFRFPERTLKCKKCHCFQIIVNPFSTIPLKLKMINDKSISTWCFEINLWNCFIGSHLSQVVVLKTEIYDKFATSCPRSAGYSQTRKRCGHVFGLEREYSHDDSNVEQFFALPKNYATQATVHRALITAAAAS